MKKLTAFIAILVLSISFNPLLFAHSGRTNADGCHYNRKTGDYHCHNKKKAKRRSPVVAPAETTTGIVKKSRNGICHDSSSRYYKRTKYYTAYNSIEECLESGGRLPK